MSTRRVVLRNAWRGSNTLWRWWTIQYAGRHATFQRKLIAARLALGLKHTSSDMHHLNGETL